ncbi:ABC transporter substrate-binding protein [Oceaniglobus trochenteri]|uniref:ABC transporter substrate-binding protein n=1 Tax=Oceaniglobus trochenteri TaxID=2763260 RepID=UPI001CFF7D95|nr:sugar ABC transporter substrate-binding protein [Oceaniglobus trochenteri]
MNRRTLMRGAFVAGTALLAAGTAATAQDKTTINFLSAQRDEVIQPMIEGFEKAHPDIEVIHQSVPFNDLNAATESRIGQGDTSIDVLHADTPRIPAFASQGYLLNLDDRRDVIEAAVPNAVDIEQVSYDGSIYAYPQWTSTQMMYFNRKILEDAGLEMPSDDPESRLTWEELLDMARTVQENGVKYGLTFQQVDRYYQLQFLFESAGAGSGLTGDDMLTPDITNEGWVKTAAWYGDLYENGLAPRGVTPEQTDDLFINGEVAFMIAGPWAIARYDANPDLDYGVAPVPYFEGGKPSTPTGSWSVAINPNSEKLDAARAFAEYVTLDPEGVYLSIAGNPNTLVNAEAYKKYAADMEALTDKIGSAIGIISHETQNTAAGRPRSRGFVTFETIMNRTFSDIRNGTDAESALDGAERQLKRALGRIK